MGYCVGHRCHIALILLFLIGCIIPVVILRSVNGILRLISDYYPLVLDPISGNFFWLLCSRVLKRLLECGYPCVFALHDIFIVIVLLGSPIVATFVLSPEMLLSDACRKEFLGSLGMRTGIP